MNMFWLVPGSADYPQAFFSLWYSWMIDRLQINGLLLKQGSSYLPAFFSIAYRYAGDMGFIRNKCYFIFIKNFSEQFHIVVKNAAPFRMFFDQFNTFIGGTADSGRQ